MERLAQQVAEWCWTHEDEVIVVFDGPERGAVVALAGGNLEVRFAGRAARRDGADDVIVDLARVGDTVVTADRGLRRRLGDGVTTIGPRSFLDRLGG